MFNTPKEQRKKGKTQAFDIIINKQSTLVSELYKANILL